MSVATEGLMHLGISKEVKSGDLFARSLIFNCPIFQKDGEQEE